ncbi:MAG: sensor histidine kinase [Cyanobacteria bacterium P01_D01_bin.36]
MELANPISTKIVKILRWIEWVLLFDCAVTNFLRVDLGYIPYAHWRIVLCLLALAAFSLIPLPAARSLKYKRTYIIAGFLLLILVDTLQINHSALFELFIIKACLVLPRRDAISATVGATTVNFSQFVWQLPTRLAETKVMTDEMGVDPFLNPQTIVTDSLVGAVTGTFFVLLLGFVFVAEQRSRYRAEKLAVEVEDLATKLERSRIARDIHDSLGHTLTTLDVQLALVDRYAQNTPESKASPKLQKAITRSQQLATQCLSEARESLRTIRKSNFDLASALTDLGNDMQKTFTLEMTVHVSSLPQRLSYQIYLIAKEGLINIQKHAKAATATLSIEEKRKEVNLTLTDDGSGFDPGNIQGGYGLQGIKERSQLLGGQLTVTSFPQKGTQLRVSIPINATVV